LARRPAPLQVSFLGYPGTMGAGFIDYIVADATVLPRKDFGNFNEKAAWLPDSYQVCDVRRPISEPAPTHAQCGLPEGAFVFCCFNAAYKITPETFQSWMRLLAAAENSVLWLASPNPTAAANLRAAAQVSGIAPDRLIFAPRVPSIADHLARHRQADLFLDTPPYNAHITAADAAQEEARTKPRHHAAFRYQAFRAPYRGRLCKDVAALSERGARGKLRGRDVRPRTEKPRQAQSKRLC
jgi:predicted O-linked N-acetylglucosamine transferase (SPINDLY family)